MSKNFSQASAFMQVEAEKKERAKTAKTIRSESINTQGRAKNDKAPADPVENIKAEAMQAGYVLRPEPKTKHLNLLLQQSVYDALKAKAEAEGKSVNDLANNILKEATL